MRDALCYVMLYCIVLCSVVICFFALCCVVLYYVVLWFVVCVVCVVVSYVTLFCAVFGLHLKEKYHLHWSRKTWKKNCNNGKKLSIWQINH